MKKLEGKVAIVTGASRGVGEFMAVELAKEGCNIVVAARSEEVKDPKLPGTIYSTADMLQGLGVRALPVRMDATDEDSINAMVQQTVNEFGRIDILVNNAGIMFPGSLLDLPIKRWDLIWRVNVRGAVIASKAALPHMIKQRDGVIINISSIAADQDGANNISYKVTKHALREFSEGLAAEVKQHNVRVFALSPYGWVPTPGTLYHRLDESMPSVSPLLEKPEAMGQAAIYLCGDEAKELSGQHFYSRHLLRDRVNNGVDLYQGEEADVARSR
jgi:citronellol/citronellal dehydrogenase